MIEVCFFEVYLKAVSLCMCRLLLSIIFWSCTCLFSLLNVFPPCSPDSFPSSVLRSHWVCLVRDCSPLNGYLKNLCLPETANLGCLQQAFSPLNLAVGIRCVADFGIVEISHQSQKGTTFFNKFSIYYIIRLILSGLG